MRARAKGGNIKGLPNTIEDKDYFNQCTNKCTLPNCGSW